MGIKALFLLQNPSYSKIFEIRKVKVRFFLILKRLFRKLILASYVSIPSTNCILKVKVSFENIEVCFEKNYFLN
jgi:hypothetical protein